MCGNYFGGNDNKSSNEMNESSDKTHENNFKINLDNLFLNEPKNDSILFDTWAPDFKLDVLEMFVLKLYLKCVR